jgi:exopolysaccharide production protein ExoQ
VLTKTRTALATVLVGVAVIHMVGRPAREWLIYATSAMSLVAAGLIAATVFNLPLERKINKLVTLGRSGGGDDTLTGRVPLWGFILHETRSERLQGAGYGAFWLRERTERANDSLRWFPRQSHNSYVEVLANLGLVGVVLAVSIGLVALARALSLAAHVGGAATCATAGLLAAAFVNGFTETAFVMPRDIGLVTAALVFSIVLQPSRQTAYATRTATRNRALKKAAPFVPRRTSLGLLPGQQGD